jgi:Haem-degrading
MKTSALMYAGTVFLAGTALRAQSNGCAGLPDINQLKQAAMAARAAENSGLNAQEWVTIVDRNGIVCAVTFTGPDATTQMGIGRISSAMRANAGNAFAFDSSSSSNGAGFPGGLALSTANLYSATQPGGFVGEMPNNYPVNTSAIFSKPVSLFGTAADPMVGQMIGGFTGVGGGLGLFAQGQKAVGGIGVAGDHACTDHDIAWRTRNLLNLDHMSGFAPLSGDPSRPDNIVYDITPNPNGGIGISAGGLGHPHCGAPATWGDPSKLPAVQK